MFWIDGESSTIDNIDNFVEYNVNWVINKLKQNKVIIWFDGKTQWSYVRKNDEVNVSTPNESQLQALNPYNFIYMYKKGYNSTLAKKGSNYEVHLTATDKKKSVQEMYITIQPKTYIPSEIRIKHPRGWNTIEVNNVKKGLYIKNGKKVMMK